MQERLSRQEFYRRQPTLVEALVSVQDAVQATSLDPGLIHLVKLRASQLNGCAFCQRMHAEEARRDGERQARLDVLPAWRESPGFDERERAALAWTEALTRLDGEGIPAALHERMERHFDVEERLYLTAAVVVINGWNRVVATCGFLPELD